MLESIQNWLTPERRKAIYNLTVAAGAALVAFGLITADKSAAVSGVVLALTNMLASLNVNQ